MKMKWEIKQTPDPVTSPLPLPENVVLHPLEIFRPLTSHIRIPVDHGHQCIIQLVPFNRQDQDPPAEVHIRDRVSEKRKRIPGWEPALVLRIGEVPYCLII